MKEMRSDEDISYYSGFGNFISTEAIKNALPKGQNSPQRCPFGLYAEQLSGSPFTAPRKRNLFSWFYRKLPSVKHYYGLQPEPTLSWCKESQREAEYPPNQLRWSPIPIPKEKIDFIDGVVSIGKGGDAMTNVGCHIYLYSCSVSMNRTFTNRDGDLLVVPQSGKLNIRTEFGLLTVVPTEICVIQRGMAFQILLEGDSGARGYMLELYEGHFELPELGPIGANGLANRNDFLIPKAALEKPLSTSRKNFVKFANRFYSSTTSNTIFDVVAWKGCYYPYKYDLKKFCAVNSVTYDHPDPSIYTVLTAPTSVPGQAACDFVIFPPRWIVGENTFRPPWFHKNFMTEFMGLIHGNYDAKVNKNESDGFFPGGSSLHQMMTAHGPDMVAVESALKAEMVPHFLEPGLAFMFETCYPLLVSGYALSSNIRQVNYEDCWKDIKETFDETREVDLSDNILQWRKTQAAKL